MFPQSLEWMNMGTQVVLWTLNDEASFARAFKIGASGVLTDYPTRLAAFLHNNPDLLAAQ